MNAVVIGIGNEFRRDDGIGPAVAQRVAAQALPGVCVVTEIAEPTALLDVWTGVARAVVVDAAFAGDAPPGRIRRWTAPDLPAAPTVSSHALGLAQACALGHSLGRMPGELVVFTVDVADTGQGPGLSAAVAAALPAVVRAVVAELNRPG